LTCVISAIAKIRTAAIQAVIQQCISVTNFSHSFIYAVVLIDKLKTKNSDKVLTVIVPNDVQGAAKKLGCCCWLQ